MTLPIKIEFKDYPSGSWIDWSDYLTEPPSINKRVESENEGEAGVIVFDQASVSFYYQSGNPAYTAFSGDLSSKQRYLFRISAPKSNHNYVQLFEGVADFSTIKWPELGKVISFEIIDKLSALGVLPAEPARVEDTLNLRILAQLPTAYYLQYDGFPPVMNELKLYVKDVSDQFLELTAPIVFPGELLKVPFVDEYLLVKSSTITFDGFYYFNTVILLLPFSETFLPSKADLSENICIYLHKEIWGVDCNNVSGDVLLSLDGLKVIQALYNQAWPGVTPILKPDTLTFPIPSEYAIRIVDEEPLGGTPLDAIKTLSWTMKCYIYINSAGNLVIHSKASLGTTGTARSLGTTKIISKEKSYFWDKLVDGVTVNVKSWITDGNDEYLEGTSTQTKQITGINAFIKPKNEITKDLLTPDADENTQELLDARAATEAAAILEFYGNRRSSYQLTLNLDDNILDGDDGPWELVDNLTIDSVVYFFTGIEMDLAARTVSLTPVEETGHEYDFRQVVVGLSESESSSVSSGSGGGGGYGVPAFLSKNIIYPEQSSYGAKGDGVTNDTVALQAAFNAAVGKTLMLTQSYLVSSLIAVNLGENNIEIVGNGTSKIISTAALATGVYFAFWCGSGITYPADGAVYSHNGSNYQVIASSYTQHILTQRISGTNNPTSTGTLTKVSGTGNATYAFTSWLDGQYYIPVGAVQFNGDSWSYGTVKISDVRLEFSNTGSSYLSGLLIQDCNKVELNNVFCTGAKYCGTRIHVVKELLTKGGGAGYNLYAGLLVSASKHSTIQGGNYSYNGDTPYSTGYGLAFAHAFGRGIDNEDILVSGVKADYNLRKGIDIHNGVRGKVIGCHVKGFGYGGIYAVNEGGSEVGHEKHVSDIVIESNTVENDSTWFTAEGITPIDDVHPIQAGSFGNATVSGGSVIIQKNIIRNIDVTDLRASIGVFSHRMESIKILSNECYDTNGQEGIIVFYEGEGGVPSKVVDISHNTIEGNPVVAPVYVFNADNLQVKSNAAKGSGADYGIYVYNGGLISILDNKFGEFNCTTDIQINTGDIAKIFNNELYGRIITVAPEVLLLTGKNTTNSLGISPVAGSSILLPEMLSKSSGKVSYVVETTGVSSAINTLIVNAAEYAGCTVTFDIIIIASSANNAYSAVYHFNARAGNVESGGNPGAGAFSAELFRVSGIIGDPFVAGFIPVVQWSGSGDTRTLQVVCGGTGSYISYQINMSFSAWRLTPVQS